LVFERKNGFLAMTSWRLHMFLLNHKLYATLATPLPGSSRIASFLSQYKGLRRSAGNSRALRHGAPSVPAAFVSFCDDNG
jgi:hypothetical protein